MRGLVLLLVAATLGHAAAICTTAIDCSLGGECIDGECHCDPTWKGPNCVQLNLLPADKSTDGYNGSIDNQSTASWGGQAVFDGGEHHLIYADFDEGCGLGCWGTNSQVARAVSSSPTGPYRKVEVIAPPFHHNPTVAKVPNGPYVIVSIGNGSASLPPRRRRKTRIGDPPEAGKIMMLYSDSIKGPWKQRAGVILEPGPLDAWDSFVTNPSLYFFPNGSALMAYRGGPCTTDVGVLGKWCDAHHVAMAFATSWDAEFKRIGTKPAWENQTEDPGLFRDARGNFHILGHLFGPHGPGGHSFSQDGLTWHFAGQAYDFEVVYTDGTKETMSRRERPQVMMIDNKPAVLFTGVTAKSQFGQAYTLAQRIGTSGMDAQYVV